MHVFLHLDPINLLSACVIGVPFIRDYIHKMLLFNSFRFWTELATPPFCPSLEQTIPAAGLGKELCNGHHKRH